MQTAIRPAAPKDIPTIQQLAAIVWGKTYTPILGDTQVRYMLDKMYSAKALRQQIEEGQEFLLLEAGKEAIGFASFSKLTVHTYKLNKLYVLPGLQSKGLGKSLLEEVIARVKTVGALTLSLNVNRYNRAKGFYERLGFRVSGEEDIDIGDGYFMNDYVMELRL